MPREKYLKDLTQFTDFGLAQPVLRALAEAGYTVPTPIQAQAIPPAMEGRDLCGIAQTGTGKTAAFALPILHRLSLSDRRPPRRGCRVLVLSPTRELANQIAESFSDYGRHLPYTNTVVYGGVTISRQERALAPGVDILVATPGRLIDLIERRSLTLEGVEILVLDEADQMLDLGFIHALKRIVRMLPAKRQSLFFSATMPKNISGLADQYLRDPIQVAVTPVATTAERVDQTVIFAQTGVKQALLAHILRDPEDRARARLHPHQARCRPRGARAGEGRHRRLPPSTATSPSRSASGRSPPSRTVSAGCWWPSTSRPAASTSRR